MRDRVLSLIKLIISKIKYNEKDNQLKGSNMHPHTTANRQGWDALADVHAQTYHIDKLLAGESLLNNVIRREVGDVTGKSLCHLLCHIGTDSLSWALLGAQVTGIDISPRALHHARALAQRMDITAEFIESDILDVIDRVQKKFNIVFASTGVLCWLPDITLFARTVRHLLQDGGFFYILDGHPFRNVLLDENGEAVPGRIVGDYFRKQVWNTRGWAITPTPSSWRPSPLTSGTGLWARSLPLCATPASGLTFCMNSLSISTAVIHPTMWKITRLNATPALSASRPACRLDYQT
jgi:SAM-dependent methyltransferase